VIKTLTVENYKSLKNLRIPLNPLTVLVGPNAAGKSNILDCLAFIADVIRDGTIRNALVTRGGFGDIVWGGDPNRSVEISLAGRLDTGKNKLFEYSINIGGPNLIIQEESGFLPGSKDEKFTFHRDGNTLKYNDSTSSVSDGMVISISQLSEANTLREKIINWSFFDFQLSQMKSYQPVAKQTRLNSDGSNVATVLHWIHSEEPEVFHRVEELLKVAIPEVDRLLSPLTPNGRTYIAWRETNFTNRIPAWNMSEGSVRLVAVLVALLAPEPPSLVTFENPEVHLHPLQMEYLADILKEASQRTQILITTHSPYLLNYLPLESVLVVKKQAGQTLVERPGNSSNLKKLLQELGLGEAWYTGHLGGNP
jgi:predicted ATPase